MQIRASAPWVYFWQNDFFNLNIVEIYKALSTARPRPTQHPRLVAATQNGG